MFTETDFVKEIYKFRNQTPTNVLVAQVSAGLYNDLLDSFYSSYRYGTLDKIYGIEIVPNKYLRPCQIALIGPDGMVLQVVEVCKEGDKIKEINDKTNPSSRPRC